MSCKHLKDVFKTSSRRLQNVFKTSRRCLKDKYFVLIKTSSKRLEDVFWRRMTKANIFTLIKTSWRCLEDIFWRRRGKTSSSRWMFAGGDVWVIFSHLCFKKTLNASVIYYFYIQHVAKKILLFGIPLSCFHQNISRCTNSCFLRFDFMLYCWKPFKLQEVLISCEALI